MPAFFAAAWMVYLTNTSNMSAGYLVIAPMLMCFLFGAFLRTIVDRVNLTACGIPAVIALAVSASPAAFSMLTEFARDHVLFLWGPSISGTEIQRIVFLACFPIAVLFVGKDLRPVLKIKNDISYGIYLYGWPVAQVLIYLCVSKGINLHVAPLFAGTFVITLIIAYASWKIIEQPALKLKRRGALNRRLPASGADQVPAAQIG
jgi:peptidoglycan/LPS O-acetylase OafA/YrhL